MVTRYCKTLLSLILIVCSWHSSFAGGPMGGEIRYTYLYGSGDYEVTLVLYQTPSINASNQPVNVFLNSTCYGSDTLTMTNFIPSGMIGTPSGGVRFSADVNCGDTAVIDSLQPLAFYYRDTVTLPGKCQDYSFTYRQCCRDSVIDNIVQPENTTFFLRSKLSNLFGENTSPRFLDHPRFRFYKDVTSYDYGMAAVEPDNDSVLYRIISAKDSAGNSVTYASGYNPTQPYPSQLPFEYGIAPLQAGEYTVVIEATEHRFDTMFAMWPEIGNTVREITFFVEDTFPPGVVSSAFGGSNVVDTIRNVHCGDSVVSFKIDRFLAGSLTQEGTEFRVLGTDTLIRPVIEAGCYNVRPDLTCDSVWLKLYKPLESNDTAYVVLKVGGDGNTLLNSCGNAFAEQDLGVLILKGCQNTSLEESLNSKFFSVYPNPTKDKLTIEFEEDDIPEQVTLFDMQGRELKSVVPQSFKTEIDITSFSKGVYLLEIKSAGLSQTRLVQKL